MRLGLLEPGVLVGIEENVGFGGGWEHLGGLLEPSGGGGVNGTPSPGLNGGGSSGQNDVVSGFDSGADVGEFDVVQVDRSDSGLGGISGEGGEGGLDVGEGDIGQKDRTHVGGISLEPNDGVRNGNSGPSPSPAPLQVDSGGSSVNNQVSHGELLRSDPKSEFSSVNGDIGQPASGSVFHEDGLIFGSEEKFEVGEGSGLGDLPMDTGLSSGSRLSEIEDEISDLSEKVVLVLESLALIGIVRVRLDHVEGQTGLGFQSGPVGGISDQLSEVRHVNSASERVNSGREINQSGLSGGTVAIGIASTSGADGHLDGGRVVGDSVSAGTVVFDVSEHGVRGGVSVINGGSVALRGEPPLGSSGTGSEGLTIALGSDGGISRLGAGGGGDGGGNSVVGGIGRTQLVDSDVIDRHFGVGPRADGVGVGRTLCGEETSSDGDVEEHVESLIERLSVLGIRIGSFSGEERSLQCRRSVLDVVDIPSDGGFGPNDGEDVEVGVEISDSRNGSGTGSFEDVVGPSTSKVEGSFDLVQELSSGFHDIDFSGSGPSSVNGVGRQHPNGGPKEISFRNFGSDLEFSVFPRGRVGELGVDSSRGEISRPSARILIVVGASGIGTLVSLWRCGEGEESVRDGDVFAPRGVALELGISSSPAVYFVLPFGEVERVSIELIRPYEIVRLRVNGAGQ